MADDARLRWLRFVLVVVGLICIFGIYPLTVLWPSGWTWGPGHSHYLVMILGLVGIPPEGIGMILGVDRFLDMCRTTLNVTGDLAAAVVVARGEPQTFEGYGGEG